MVRYEAHTMAIASLFEGVATIIVRESVKDPITKVMTPQEVEKETFPCRLSFTKNKVEEKEHTWDTERTMTLFVGPKVVIPIGSKIKAIQAGAEFHLQASGLPAVYGSHREYPVSEFSGWL
ncbi:MAG: hypothetical protein Q4Q07_10345 [Tissierellia bacterium]|nr:hypothetical protein [Tissierellia bacterium]